MRAPLPNDDTEPPRAARRAVAVLFFTNAALFANAVPRYPDIKDDLGLGNAEIGSAIAGFPLGALLVGLLAAAIINRLGSAPVAVGGLVLLSLAFTLVAAAANWGGLAAVLFVAGALDAVVDVAQNAHGLRVQRLYGRSILNSFHAVWSIGAVTGGLMGSAAAGLGIPLGLHLGGSAALFGLLSLGSRRFLLAGPDGREPALTAAAAAAVPASPTTRGRRLRAAGAAAGALLLLGLVTAADALIEDGATSWGAIYLRDSLGAAAATAGMAFVALQAAMTFGRLLADRAVDRLGQGPVVRAGGTMAAAGMGVALAVPSVPGTILGFAVAGLGVAPAVPAAMHAADELPGLPPGAGLTFVSWTLRVGFLVSAPAVGLVADAASLRIALLGVVLAGLLLVFAAPALGGRRDPARPNQAPRS